MVILQNISYVHADKQALFTNISLVVNAHAKMALIGNNGTGKSTLLRIIAGELSAHAGQRMLRTEPYYIPQLFGQFDHLTVAQALKVDSKLNALHAILNGDPGAEHFSALGEDWTIEERCREALRAWQLDHVALTRRLETMSGGEKMKVFLAGITLHAPALVLLDEPSNHLDREARLLLHALIRSAKSTLVIVSHDRELLNLCSCICELDHRGITTYGGNYDFYAEQKEIERNALQAGIHSKEKELRKAREKKRETLERQQKLNARGKAKQEKAGVARIMLNTLRNLAENSTAKMNDVHAEKIGGLNDELKQLQSALPDLSRIRFGFGESALHKGKVLFRGERINFRFGTQRLWKNDLDVQLLSGDRIALQGSNGSGKTTLLQTIAGLRTPDCGDAVRAGVRCVYIDQEYSVLDPALNVYEQAQRFNTSGLEAHEVNTRLNRFLFTSEQWSKPCTALSGGERMRLLLCGLTLAQHAPDLLLLDEPTNNLDLQSVEILTAALKQYTGTLVVVSHDEWFVREVSGQFLRIQ